MNRILCIQRQLQNWRVVLESGARGRKAKWAGVAVVGGAEVQQSGAQWIAAAMGMQAATNYQLRPAAAAAAAGAALPARVAEDGPRTPDVVASAWAVGCAKVLLLN